MENKRVVISGERMGNIRVGEQKVQTTGYKTGSRMYIQHGKHSQHSVITMNGKSPLKPNKNSNLKNERTKKSVNNQVCFECAYIHKVQRALTSVSLSNTCLYSTFLPFLHFPSIILTYFINFAIIFEQLSYRKKNNNK